MEKKKFNFKKFGLVLCLCFITLFAFIPFANFTNVDSVNADTITYDYTFTSSNLLAVSATWYDSDSGASRTGFVLPTFIISTTQVSKSLTVTAPVYTVWRSADSFDTLNSTTTNLSTTQYDWNVPCVSSRRDYIPFTVVLSSNDFIANIYKVRIYSESFSSYNFTTHIIYYDINDNYIDIEICNWQDTNIGDVNFHNFMYSDRTYYFSTALTGDANYQAGYNDGYNTGKSDGSNVGYDDGYNVGYDVGLNDGYNNGINDSNQYSFYNLFGAVIDAPVKVFSGLFNFNFLGVNLLGLITGLFTLAMIIMIIKLILGGK